MLRETALEVSESVGLESAINFRQIAVENLCVASVDGASLPPTKSSGVTELKFGTCYQAKHSQRADVDSMILLPLVGGSVMLLVTRSYSAGEIPPSVAELVKRKRNLVKRCKWFTTASASEAKYTRKKHAIRLDSGLVEEERIVSVVFAPRKPPGHLDSLKKERIVLIAEDQLELFYGPSFFIKSLFAPAQIGARQRDADVPRRH